MSPSLQRFTDLFVRWTRRLFRRDDDERIRARARALRSSAVFGDLPKRHLAAVAEVVHERHYKRDEHIYYQDDPGLGLYLVREGRVVLTRRGDDETEIGIAELGEGDVFGVLSAFEDLRRTETAQSLADTVVLGLFRPDLHALSARRPSAGASVYRVLARHMGRKYAVLLSGVEEACGRTKTMAILSETVQDETA